MRAAPLNMMEEPVVESGAARGGDGGESQVVGRDGKLQRSPETGVAAEAALRDWLRASPSALGAPPLSTTPSTQADSPLVRELLQLTTAVAEPGREAVQELHSPRSLSSACKSRARLSKGRPGRIVSVTRRRP